MAIYGELQGVSAQLLEEFGAPVTFRRERRVEDPETGLSQASHAEVSGVAMRVKGDPLRYQALGVVEIDTVTLLFAASTYGDEVRPGDTVRWPGSPILPTEGRPYTVRDVDPVAPDGHAIISRVTVSR